MFSRTSSNASNATLASTASTTSTLAPQETPKKGTQKDYFAALGKLQSSYGFGGAAPTLPTPPTPTKSKKAAKSSSTTTTSTSTSTSSATTNDVKASKTRDYEAAHGALSSSFGFGGAAPALPQSNASWLKK